MTDFYKSDTYLIVQKMKASGNQAGVIQLWKNMVEEWAMKSDTLDAAGVRAWLPAWQARAAYTADELAPLWPALAVALGICRNVTVPKSVNRLTNELKFAGLPFREFRGRTYFIVERCHFWKDAPESAFEQEIQNAF